VYTRYGFYLQQTQVYFEDAYYTTDVYNLNSLSPGQIIDGPAIIMNSLSTILIEPGCTATITLGGDIKIKIGSNLKSKITKNLDMIHLSIFSHRFMSIAEEMGRFVFT
jgi:5-oxoprolinase (ATP-hydrolysing)